MVSKVYCKTTAKGVQSFYLAADGKEYFLFSQDYRVSNKQRYGRGVTIDKAISLRADSSYSVSKTSGKIETYVRYIEQEYGICVLKRTMKKKNILRHRPERNDSYYAA